VVTPPGHARSDPDDSTSAASGAAPRTRPNANATRQAADTATHTDPLVQNPLAADRIVRAEFAADRLVGARLGRV